MCLEKTNIGRGKELESLGLFLKLFLRTVFENTRNIILGFSKSYSCYLNLVFFVFFL